MLTKLFTEQRSHINFFFEKIDAKQAEKFAEACLACKGLLVFSGVGKSGLVAEKIAATLTSTGTKALFLPPTNFLHGDLGILSENDLLILISKSGETEELLQLVPFAKKRKTSLLSLVSNPRSRLAQASDLIVHLPLEKELCPFDLAPTTSTVIQLLFGDILAVSLMQAKKFSIDHYALNHPAGSIGKKATVFVKDLMLQGETIPLCAPSDHLIDVIASLSDKRCGCLLVVDAARKLLGIFTDGDLRRALQAEGSSVLHSPMHKLMTPSALWTEPHLLAFDAMKQMQKEARRWIMVLPVLEEGKVTGIVRLHDIIQALS